MVWNRYLGQAGLPLSLAVAFSVVFLVSPSVGAISVNAGTERSTFSRSLDVLRVRDNHFVRGIPCAVACEFCGCEGSYIGDKCVCFCSGDTKESTDCLTAIRKDELSSGIDNDILILMRTGARFARDLRQRFTLKFYC
uniref:Uncharacterized protein n=1 Tax=Anopheles atroparvus TaxID=41427 RepID=A0A182IJ50_ANOAO